MCIAILQTTEKPLDYETIRRCWRANSDGAGLAIAYRGKILVHKELNNPVSFYAAYSYMRRAIAGNMLLHFRWCTHGLADASNAHPFLVADNLAVIHNGIIPGYRDPADIKSDTSLFCSDFLASLPNGFHRDKSYLNIIGQVIGGSKLVFLDRAGRASIVNENAGIWDGGDWYSNDGYKARKYDWGKLASGFGSWAGYSDYEIEDPEDIDAYEESRIAADDERWFLR